MSEEINKQINATPLLSVIVPAYNIVNDLLRCVNSIISQDYSNIELIIVDDGSSDGTSKACDELAASDSRIIIVHKENGGVSSARNYGISICKGEYVTFVDGDDFIEHGMFNYLMKLMQESNADLIISDFNVYQDNKIIPSTYKIDKIFKSNIFHYTMMDRIPLTAWGKIIKRDLIIKDKELLIKFPDKRKYEDSVFSLNVILNSSKTLICSKRFYYYVQRGDSLSHLYSISDVNDLLANVQDENKILDDKKNKYQEDIDIFLSTTLSFALRISNNISNGDKNINYFIKHELKKRLKRAKVHNIVNSRGWKMLLLNKIKSIFW